jgi:subtilisin-like proprotein convertase family protein
MHCSPLDSISTRIGLSTVVVGLALVGVASPASAALPPPANDTPATAEPVGALPAILTGSNVGGDDTINTTTLPAVPSVPGPDVFYSFTPAASGDYWVVMIPWDQIPVYASSGGSVPVPNLCVYLREAGSGTFVAGSDANPRGQADTVIVTLTGSTEYEIVVDSTETVARGQQFEFMLVVADAPSGSAEDCAAGATISNALPTAVVNTLTGASDDFTFVEGTGRCDVADPFGTVVPGPDHVYEFTTGPDPSDAGDYVFNLIPGGSAWDGYVYIADSCPPFLPLGCLGAASHTSSSTRQAEAIVVTLLEEKTYYVYVDTASFSLPDAKYTLLVDRADAYDINEVEPNDSPGTATPLSASSNGAQVVGGSDVDEWSLTADAGDRLFAFVDTGAAPLSEFDTELRVIGVDGSTVVEFDDDDGEGATSSIPTFTLRSSAFSAAVAGTPLFASGTYTLRVNSATTTGTVARYRVHYGLEPATRSPAPECEPNDVAGFADGGVKEYYTGVIDVEGDVDFFTFEAVAGDRVYIALDGDPERNSGGVDPDSPLALDGALRVLDPDGDPLFDDVDDKSGVGSGQAPDYPAEALFFVAPLSGTYAIEVSGGDADDYGAGRTYELAVFKSNAAPTPADDVDPTIDSVTPDFQTDTVAVEASDDEPGDSGVCAVSLADASYNLTLLNLTFTPGDPTVSFDVGLVNANTSGIGKVIVTDCDGNTACAAITIDADAPSCGGSAVVSTRRVFHSRHGPIHVPNNEPAGPGIEGEIEVTENGTITDVNVTITVETIRPPDIDVYLESPIGTIVEIVTDRGSSLAFDITDATFDDDAEEIMSILSSDAPYTGTWLPEDPAGLAQLNGENAQGTWKLNVIDDSNDASGGARLVRWSLDIDAGFANPEVFEGTADDTGGDNSGIQSIVLSDEENVELNLPPGFTPGDVTVDYSVTLLNPSTNGVGTITVTDLSNNTCQSIVAINGLADSTAPEESGATSRNLEFGAEVLADVPSAVPAGVVSSIAFPESVVVGEVEVDLTVDTKNVGRIASTLTHDGQFAALINRVGMDERGSVGLTKDNIELTLDDDAPVADDAHLEPALGTIEFLGLHQPDGRGEFIGDGIDTDDRDNMMFTLEGLASDGTWELYVGDFREQGAGEQQTTFRRWSATVRSPGGPERYTGTAVEFFPQAGICTVELAGGADNLVLDVSFTPGDEQVDYAVSLSDPAQSGTGTLEITDCAGNTTQVPISLSPGLADQQLPVVDGSVNGATFEFEGTATDNQAGDSGIASIELAPYANNLQIVSVNPDPPNGAGTVDFVVGLINPAQNGRGYVRVTDVTGYRRHALVEIDAVGPGCTGSIGRTKRYVSTDLPKPIPDNSGAGATSVIAVPDLGVISDVNLTVNIIHPMDDDIDLSLTTPAFIQLFSDIGGTGNDFTDTVLDDEAAIAIPDTSSEAPFTGSYRPEAPATLSILDGNIAAGNYTLKAVDDAVYNVGSFESWSVTIESATFPERYDGRAEDGETFASGLCTVELLPGAANLTLTTDAFTAGDAIVRYSVKLTNPALHGTGTVRVSDCADNVCDVPVCLTASYPPAVKGDLNGDGAIDLDDYDEFAACLGGPTQAGFACGDLCEIADFDDDGDVDLSDFAGFQEDFESS